MRVGIIQSNYLPWRGYFDFIADVDLFIFHDDLQYTKGDWRNRNRIKTPDGPRWLTVPVHHHATDQRICDTEIDRSTRWGLRHLNLIRQHYSGTIGLDLVCELLSPLRDESIRTISELNVGLVERVCRLLGIDTRLAMSSEFRPTGRKTERLIGILESVGATSYLSGATADAYLDKQLFREAGIRLEYKTYDYAPYAQPWPPFEGQVSIVDLVACTGDNARTHFRSRSPNRVITG